MRRSTRDPDPTPSASITESEEPLSQIQSEAASESEELSEEPGVPLSEMDFFERMELCQRKKMRMVKRELQKNKSKELIHMQEKPEINASSNELAKSRTQGVKLYRRVDDELKKKKDKIQKLKEVLRSKQKTLLKENDKFDEELDPKNNFLSPYKKLNKTPKTPKRTLEEFVSSMNTWTERKRQNIAAQEKMRIDRELKELSFKPDLSKSKRWYTPRKGDGVQQFTPKKKPPEIEDETKVNGNLTERGAFVSIRTKKPIKRAVTPKSENNLNAFERNYLVFDEQEESRLRLIEKYLNSTCTFKPKISQNTNKLIKNMEKRDFIKRNTTPKKNKSNKPSETPEKKEKNFPQNETTPNPSNFTFLRSTTMRMTTTQKKDEENQNENQISDFQGLPETQSKSNAKEKSPLGQIGENALGNRSAQSQKKTINDVEYEPGMESIVKKVKEVQSLRTPSKKSDHDKENKSSPLKRPM